MKRFGSVFLFLLLATCSPSDAPKQETASSAYDRIMASQTIRCAYIIYPPSLMRDANTGRFSGISYDIITRMAQDLGLKIEWVEEAHTPTAIEGLKSNRYDLMCTSVWANARRGREAQFSVPLYFTAINAYARKDDNRFTADLAKANQKNITIATVDGGVAAGIAAEDFPNAQTFSMPELTDFSQLLMNVDNKKADLTFSETAQVLLYERSHPDSLQNLTPERPVRLFANSFMMRMGEDRLKEMLDNAIRNLHNSGFIDKTIASYEEQPNEFRRVAPAYQ